MARNLQSQVLTTSAAEKIVVDASLVMTMSAPPRAWRESQQRLQEVFRMS